MQPNVHKRCVKCEQSKPLSEFNSAQRNADGYTGKCKACLKKYQAVWRQNNEPLRERKAAYQQANREILSEKAVKYRKANRERIAKTELKRKSTIKGRATILFANARGRAQKSGMDFTIAVEDVLRLLATGKCQQSGILFDLRRSANSHFNPFGPSIDRIDSAHGYEPENIQLVCDMFNRGKGEARELDFIAMCVAVAKKHQSNPAVIVRLMELGIPL